MGFILQMGIEGCPLIKFEIQTASKIEDLVDNRFQEREGEGRPGEKLTNRLSKSRRRKRNIVSELQRKEI